MSINDYYRSILRRAEADIQSFTDQAALEFDAESWGSNVFDTLALQPIQLAQDREPELRELTSGVRFVLPVVPSLTLEIITTNGLTSSTRSISVSSGRIAYDHSEGELWIDAQEEIGGVQTYVKFLTDQVVRWNNDINANNGPIRRSIEQAIAARVAAAGKRQNNLREIERATGIKLVARNSPRAIVPVALPPKREVRPLLRREAKERRPVLDRDTFNAIISLVHNQGRQFERTPGAFSTLGEEDLRDILLSSLNAWFEGGASGEAFSVLGKTDIHLPLASGDLFIAECKWWSGISSLADALRQLLDRLTWHESFGVVVVFSANTNFGNVVNEIELGLPKLPHFKGPSRKVGSQHFAAPFELPSDTTRSVEVHVLAYSLFTTRKPGRSKA